MKLMPGVTILQAVLQGSSMMIAPFSFCSDSFFAAVDVEVGGKGERVSWRP